MTTSQEILFSEIPGNGGDVGQILLNRPKALNALSKDMCVQIFEQLKCWESANNIKAVIVKGAGDRAFCAGGDIKKLYDNREASVEQKAQFFWHEYRMNSAIFHFEKPYIAFLNGITMGGGAGVSIHGSHRVASEKLLFAMPETAIGFYPDIGASHFLSHCPGKTGLFLALTGHRIEAAEALALGLATQVIASTDLENLENKLIDTKFSGEDHNVVTEIIESFISNHSDSIALNQYRKQIDNYFAKDSVESIIQSLKNANDD